MIKQQTEILEFLTGFEIPNKYNITMSNGETLHAAETSECIERLYCG